MGLVICKKIVDNCGGTIEVFSEGTNKGSTFIFTMSMVLPKAECQQFKSINDKNLSSSEVTKKRRK